MYLANKIHKELDIHFPTNLIGEELSYSKISKLFNNILRPMGAKFRVMKDEGLKGKRGSSRQKYAFSGYFDTEKKKDAIVITLHVSPTKRKFKVTKTSYNGLLFLFSQVVQHEFIHKSQFAFRPEQSERKVKVYHSDKISKKRLYQIEYLREWCEIEAYAHDIAMEINAHYPEINPVTVIKHIDKYRNLYSFKVYKTTFKGTDWNRLKKSLLRKVWRWISCAQTPVAV